MLIPPRSDRMEILDSPPSMIDALDQNLRDIRRLNRVLGGTTIAMHVLSPLVKGGDVATVLDVATGSGDIPMALVRWATRRGKGLRVTGLDVSVEVLQSARTHTHDALELVVGEAQAIPFGDDSFDVVMCCLALHHWNEEAAKVALSEMWRTARRAVVVVDLVRSYPAYVGTWAATRVLARSPVTRHDGPLSVLRAYTPDEVVCLARGAGLENIQSSRHPLFRQSLTAIKRYADA